MSLAHHHTITLLAALAAGSFAPLGRAQGWDHNAYNGGVYHTSITNSFVNKVVAGTGNELFVGGFFNNASGPTVANVARFAGSTGNAMGPGIATTVTAMARSTNGTVFAGGQNGAVYEFTGTSWVQRGLAFNASIRSLAVEANGTVVAAGSFTSPVVGVARLVSGSWSAIGAGFAAPTTVNSVDIDATGQIFAAGSLTAIGLGSTNLSVFNGSTWTTFVGGAAPAGTIDVMRLAPGGTVITAHQAPFSINRGTASGWASVATSLSGGTVRDVLGLPSNETVVCGSFTMIDGVPAACVARHDGTTWTALATSVTAPTGITPSINSMAIKNNNRIAMGGNFTLIGSAASRLIDRRPDVDGSVSTIALSGCNNAPVQPLSSNNMPLIGTQFDSSISNLPANSALLQVIGINQRSQLMPPQPPVNLSSLPINGDPNCNLDITDDILMGPTVFSGTTATVSVFLQPAVLGFTIYQQVVIFDLTPAQALTRITKVQAISCGKL